MSAAWQFEWLLGEWAFEREISGRGPMNGMAAITWVEGKRALYRESGELILKDGQRLQSHQSYFYDQTEDGFEVRFYDTGKLFHQLTFEPTPNGDWRATASHNCAADRYDSQYLFQSNGTFEVSHNVEGPRKDYTIRTTYRKRGIA